MIPTTQLSFMTVAVFFILAAGPLGCAPNFAELEEYDQAFLSASRESLEFQNKILREMPKGKKYTMAELLEVSGRHTRMQVDFYEGMVRKLRAITPPKEREKLHTLFVKFFELGYESSKAQAQAVRARNLRQFQRLYNDVYDKLKEQHRRIVIEVQSNAKNERLLAAIGQMF